MPSYALFIIVSDLRSEEAPTIDSPMRHGGDTQLVESSSVMDTTPDMFQGSECVCNEFASKVDRIHFIRPRSGPGLNCVRTTITGCCTITLVASPLNIRPSVVKGAVADADGVSTLCEGRTDGKGISPDRGVCLVVKHVFVCWLGCIVRFSKDPTSCKQTTPRRLCQVLAQPEKFHLPCLYIKGGACENPMFASEQST